MPDQPELQAEGRRTSQEFALNIQLNEEFVRTVGEDKAEAFRRILVDMSAHPASNTDEIQAELERRVGDLGIQVSEPELKSFSDQILRSAGPVEQVSAQMVDDPNRTVR